MITDFKRAGSVAEAVALQKQGYLFLAGGTQVNNAGYKKQGTAVEKVVSLDALDLGGIEEEKGAWIIGAGVTLQELADSAVIPGALKSAAGFIPTRSVRNIATIGGNVGAKRPDSYIIPALIALGAAAETVEGTVGVEEYLSSENRSLILRFRIPRFEGVCKAVKESRSHLALPVVSAAVRIAAGKESIVEAVVAAGCVARRTLRLRSVEAGLLSGELLLHGKIGELLEAAIASAVEPQSDFLGSTAFKKYENSVVIADCIRACLKEARG